MNHFLRILKIVVGIPFFAVIGVFTALFCFAVDSLLTYHKNPQKEQQKEDLNKRKEEYKKNLKPLVINDYGHYINSSLSWDDDEPNTAINQKQRKKKKELNKRRKRNRIAKKSRQQNRK